MIGFNEYFGYFYGKEADLGPTLDAVLANHPGKPILITENGTWSFPGNRGRTRRLVYDAFAAATPPTRKA